MNCSRSHAATTKTHSTKRPNKHKITDEDKMGRNSCFLLPHGGYALLPTVLTTMAWVASIFQDSCDYAIIEGPIVQTITDDDDSVPWVEVGFAAFRVPEYVAETDKWEVTYTGACTDYDLDRIHLDPAWKTAKAFAFLALVLGGGGALFLWFSACCVFSKATWRWAGYEVLLAAIFQVLAFLWFGNSLCQNKNVCRLSWGSKADIVASVLWGLAAMAIFCKYPAPKLPPNVRQQGEMTNPEIAITGLEGRPYQQQQRHGSAATATSTTIQTYEGNSHIAAGLPLAGDATATMATSPNNSPKKSSKSNQAQEHFDEFVGGKDLQNVEVL